MFPVCNHLLERKMRIIPTYIPAIAVLGLIMAGCTSGSETLKATGYGERPLTPEATIARAVSSRDVHIIDEPDPFYLYTQENWLYGWRTCAHLDNGNRQGFFLLRGDTVIYQALIMADATQQSLSEVGQYCPGLIGADKDAPPALSPSRIDVKN